MMIFVWPAGTTRVWSVTSIWSPFVHSRWKDKLYKGRLAMPSGSFIFSFPIWINLENGSGTRKRRGAICVFLYLKKEEFSEAILLPWAAYFVYYSCWNWNAIRIIAVGASTAATISSFALPVWWGLRWWWRLSEVYDLFSYWEDLKN